MPPTELTASTTTLKRLRRTASTSTSGRASTRRICSSLNDSRESTCPSASTSGNSKSLRSANSNTRLPSASERNSPSASSSFNAFHWRGLCEAVMMMPPSASWAVTASSTPGVVQSPTLTTSAPQPSRAPSIRSPTKTCVAADDDPQAALFALAQKTDVGSGEFHDVERGQIVARAAADRTADTRDGFDECHV